MPILSHALDFILDKPPRLLIHIHNLTHTHALTHTHTKTHVYKKHRKTHELIHSYIHTCTSGGSKEANPGMADPFFALDFAPLSNAASKM